MKNIYILIFISTLIACSDKSQDKIQNSSNNEPKMISIQPQEPQPTVTREALATSETKANTHKDKIVATKESDQSVQISCSNPAVLEWYGFDEAFEEPQCQKVNKFHLISYKCELSKNAFGADNDAILLENNEQRVIAYSSLKDCNESLEIRNSNAP